MQNIQDTVLPVQNVENTSPDVKRLEGLLVQ